MLLSSLCLIFGVVTLTSGAVIGEKPTKRYVKHEKREIEYSPWVKHERVARDTIVPFKIALTQSNLEYGHDRLMEISDPRSPSYGQHYTAEEVKDMFAPAKETVDGVKAWLLSAGIDHQRVVSGHRGDWLKVEDMEYAELERLLQTEYHIHKHSLTGDMGVACDHYHIPEHLSRHIDFVVPGVGVQKMRGRDSLTDGKSSTAKQKRQTRGVNPHVEPGTIPITDLMKMPPEQRCHKVSTPDCIRLLYNVPESYKSVSGNQLGIFEPGISQVLYQGYLNQYFRLFVPNIPNGTHPVEHSIDGGKSTTNNPNVTSGIEIAIDVDVAYGILTNRGDLVVFPAEDDQEYPRHDGLYNNFLDGIDASYCNYTAFGETGDDPSIDAHYPDPKPGGYKGPLGCGVWKPTNVISISYGPDEFEYPVFYSRRQCNEFMKLALQGVTTVAASGDEGVASGECFKEDPFREPLFSGFFGAISPTSCPYVLSVGATALRPNISIFDEHAEQASTYFGSGGGFSNIFPRPDYQNESVEHYLTTYPPSYKSYSTKYNESSGAGHGLYNRDGRAIPDVSAIGVNIPIIEPYYGDNGNAYQLSGGTSASSPLWASLLTRINAARLAAGKKSVGFVHPVLYQNPQVFHDITIGNNPGCGTNGFNATKGWDAVTGLGSPDFSKLMDLFMSLP